MPGRFQDRLNRAAGRAFVGREAEQSLFREMVLSEEPDYLVLLVHGPGGIGKSSLLRAFGRICTEAQAEALHLDARSFSDNSDSFKSALSAALGVDGKEDPLHTMAARAGRLALLIDTYELCQELEPWLVREFLPALPSNVVVVLAGRFGPSEEWRREPGWASLMHPVALRNLRLTEAEQMLIRAGVPEADTSRLLATTHGHPLAVALTLELYQMKGGEIDAAESPDVVRALVERLVMKVPSPSHRLALEACALVHACTEELLAAMLDAPDVSQIFDWLRTLSFMDAGPSGLFPHDIAREALAAEVRWRNPGQYRELHKRARQFYVAQMHATDDPQMQRRHLRDLVYLHRDNPVVQPLFQRLRQGHPGERAASPDRPTEKCEDIVVEMIARHEGTASAAWARAWIDAAPESLTVIRGVNDVPVGALIELDMGSADPALGRRDPGMKAALAHLASAGPLRDGERATFFRFWLGAEDYQSLSYVQMTIFVHMVQHYLMTPGLAHTYLPSGITEELTPIMAYGDVYRIPEADFDVEGRTFGMFGHDWRACPPDEWLDIMGQRQVGAVPTGSSKPAVENLVILDRSDFHDAVREALKVYSRPRKLKGNVLLQASLVRARAETDDEAARVEALCTLLADAVGGLSGAGALDKAHRALDRTYIRPAGSQEAAAEMLDMPYSTFRRHLGKGLEEVAETLWQMEIAQ